MKLLICLCSIAIASADKYTGIWFSDNPFDPYASYNTPYLPQNTARPAAQQSPQFNPNVRLPPKPQKTQPSQNQGSGIGNRNSEDDIDDQYVGYTPVNQVDKRPQQQYTPVYSPQTQTQQYPSQDQQYQPDYTPQKQTGSRPQQQYAQVNTPTQQYQTQDQQYQQDYNPQKQTGNRPQQQNAQTNIPTQQYENQDGQYVFDYNNQNQAGNRPQQQYPAQSSVPNQQYPQTRPQTQGTANRPLVAGSYPMNSDSTYNQNGNNQKKTGRPNNEYSADQSPLVTSPISASTISFTLRLMQFVLGGNENVVVSPTSVSTLLALLSQGATYNSLNQLTNAVGLTAADSRTAYSGLMNSLTKQRSRNILEIANSAWVDRNFQLKPQFKNVASQSFKADVVPTNFKMSNVAARQINSWVSNKTRGIIKNLISPTQIDPSTAMVLVNAIYFKGLWKSPFDPERTVRLNFSPTPVLHQSTFFMHQEGAFVGGEDKELGAKWLELPFEGHEFSMVFILPIEQHDLPQMIHNLNATGFNKILNSKNVIKKVVMSIPKFDLDFEIELNSHLRRMGISDIFSMNSGLEGISNEQVHVSKVLQKAAITVDEFGSKAAASTALAVNTLSLSGYWDEFHFICNQPFLAVIMDTVNKAPLFVAKVSNPASAQYQQY